MSPQDYVKKLITREYMLVSDRIKELEEEIYTFENRVHESKNRLAEAIEEQDALGIELKKLYRKKENEAGESCPF